MDFKILVLLPGFMFYMESVNEFVKPKIVETRELKSTSTRVSLQRNELANYNRKNVGFRGKIRIGDIIFLTLPRSQVEKRQTSQ